MRRYTVVAWVATVLALLAAPPRSVEARMRADRAAAIINFPYVTVDSRHGVDTAIRLSNADAAAAIDVSCFLINVTPHCFLDPLQGCLVAADCAPGDVCAPAPPQVLQFGMGLTMGQPISWSLSVGLPALPVPGTGAIPPASEDPFLGVLRCVAVGPSGVPVDRNVLQGEATVERYDSAASQLDAATYNGVGLGAIAGAIVDDGQLVLGGPDAEYDGCPNVLILNHFFDFAVDPVTHASQIFTTLALVPCAADLSRSSPDQSQGATIVEYMVFNEFEQRFSTSLPLAVQQVRQLSLIDGNDPTRSIFSAGVGGTLSGQTRMRGIGAGIMGVADESHRDLTDATRAMSAAFNLHATGERLEPDTISLTFGCTDHPMAGCRTAPRNRLRVTDRVRDRRDRVAWQWREGQATTVSDFGDPVHSTAYALCIYAGTSAASVVELRIPPSSAHWTSTSNGVTYKDVSGAADGVWRGALRASDVDRARAALRARGPQVPLPDLSNGLSLPVVVQLQNAETPTCLESLFDSADVVQNDPGTFEARTP